MLLAETIVARLKKEFPVQPMACKIGSEPFVTIPPRWDGFGPITLCDDGGEVIVTIGTFTHTHIEGATADAIADEIAAFLSNIFADRLVCWAQGGMGGCHAKGEEFWAEDKRPSGLRRGVWSGPIAE